MIEMGRNDVMYGTNTRIEQDRQSFFRNNYYKNDASRFHCMYLSRLYSYTIFSYIIQLPAIHVVSYKKVVMILVYIPIYVKFYCFSCLRDYQSLRKSSAKTSVTTKQVTTFVTSIVVTNSNVFFIAEKKGKKHFFKCILCYSLPIQAVIHATTEDGNMVVYENSTIISRDAYLWLDS